MRISRLIGFIAAASVLAACSGNNSAGLVGHPVTPGDSHANQRVAHALAVPGLAGRLVANRLGVPRPVSHRVHHDFTATLPCTYLSDNSSGDVQLYNADNTLAGAFGSSSYGWGLYATGSTIFVGKNDGSGSLDRYVPCTNHPGVTVVGLGTGGNAFGIAGFRGNKPGYATNWPVGDIEYWPTGASGPVFSVVDPNTPLPYFLDVDRVGNVWVTGWDSSFSNEIVDECTPTFSSCTTQAVIAGGFPGGIQVDQFETVYVDDQIGTLYQFDCSSSVCFSIASFTYNNGTNPLDYTGTALDPYRKHRLWGANIYFCGSSSGLCGDAQSQSVPLSTATLGAFTAQWDNAIPLGVARYRPDHP